MKKLAKCLNLAEENLKCYLAFIDCLHAVTITALYMTGIVFPHTNQIWYSNFIHTSSKSSYIGGILQ